LGLYQLGVGLIHCHQFPVLARDFTGPLSFYYMRDLKDLPCHVQYREILDFHPEVLLYAFRSQVVRKVNLCQKLQS
jgi:hypothetical protein